MMNFGILKLEISTGTWDFSIFSVRDEVEGQRSQKQFLFALGCLTSLTSLLSPLSLVFTPPPAILTWKSHQLEVFAKPPLKSHRGLVTPIHFSSVRAGLWWSWEGHLPIPLLIGEATLKTHKWTF